MVKENKSLREGLKQKKEALEASTKALAEFNATGVVFEASEISVCDYLNFWFDNYCKMNLKYNTQLSYIQIIENHLKPTFGHYKLKALNSKIIQDYTNSKK